MPSWNMAAAFFTLAWCCLRGLWTEAAKYLAAITAVALLWWFGLRPALPAAMALGAGVALWLAALAVPGLLGNGWYWRKVRQQTLQAISAAPNMAEVHTRLQAQAAPRSKSWPHCWCWPCRWLLRLAQVWPFCPQQTEPAMISEPVAPIDTARIQSATPAAKPAAEPVPQAAAAQTVPATPEPAPAVAAPPASEPAAPAAMPAHAETAAASQPASDLQPGKFYLNLGAFSNQTEAKQALSLLEKRGCRC